jgi:hypothetical protein
MNLAGALAVINWVAVVVSTIIAFAIGGAWYSTTLFGNAWLEEVGLTCVTRPGQLVVQRSAEWLIDQCLLDSNCLWNYISVRTAIHAPVPD